MSVSASIQTALAEAIGQGGALRVPVPILARRDRDPIDVQIMEAGNRQTGLCVTVLQPRPRAVTQELAQVSFEDVEQHLMIIEQPAYNQSGADAYQLADDLAQALQWQPKEATSPLAGLLAHPLMLAENCATKVEDQQWRIIDLVLRYAYQLPALQVDAPAFTPAGLSTMEDLQAAIESRLTAALEPQVPIIPLRDKDLASRIAQAGHLLSVKVEPPLPTRAMQGVPFVFFEKARVRCVVSEIVALNGLGIDAFDVAETVAAALHWQTFSGFLAYPLQLARTPFEIIENPDDPAKREIAVLFDATFGFVTS